MADDLITNTLSIAQNDNECKEESKRALQIFNQGDLSTKEQIGKKALFQNKAYAKAVEILGDTVYNVASERDVYKEMVGNVDQNLVDSALATKKASKTNTDKNKLIMQEKTKPVSGSKTICKPDT